MGWKNLKEYFGIKHQVHVTSQGLCIGSAYIHDLVVIDDKGTVIKGADRLSENWLAQIKAHPAKVRELLNTPDTFTASIPVYTYFDGEIIEDSCEEFDWPNVTHAGRRMFDNTFSLDKHQAVAWAIDDARRGAGYVREGIAEQERALTSRREYLATLEGHLAKLLADYPDEPVQDLHKLEGGAE